MAGVGQRTLRLAILVVLPATLAVSARATELVLAHFVSTNHPMHRAVFVPLAARLLSGSGGELTLRINPGLSDPARQYQRVTNREADLVFGLPDYTPELMLDPTDSRSTGCSYS